MAKYRSKIVEIEAIHFDPCLTFAILSEWALMLESIGDNRIEFRFANGGIWIMTLEGEMRASPGDWIIRGPKGEYCPIKPDIFELKYEKV